MRDSPDLIPFPTVRWSNVTVTFEPMIKLPPSAKIEAIVVFACCKGGFVLADIEGRGWCVPSGRLEPGETPLQAAVRETYEEIGSVLENPREIGHYILTNDAGHVSYVPAYIGTVQEFGDIPAGSESRGVCCVPCAELPALYWRWDRLLERMFEYAEQQFQADSPDAKIRE